MKQGTLIVLDGGDGAGKATQVQLLTDRLQADGHAVETLDFPRYTETLFGKLLRECLDGKRDDFMATDPRVASALYAADRFESKPRIEAWLQAGKIVILDRYVSSNMLHQGAKIDDQQELEDFLEWLDYMEHTTYGLPRPDTIIYLDVPYRVRAKLTQESVKAQKHGAAVGIDLAEADIKHQAQVEERAKLIVSDKNNWQTVRCCEEDVIRTREAIHADVFSIVQDLV